MKRGEIRWYKFKTPDKKRPVLILTRDSILEYLGEVTVAPITTTVRDIPSEVFLSKQDGALIGTQTVLASVHMTTSESDFREVSGIKVAHKTQVLTPSGEVDLRLLSLTINPEISDDLFNPEKHPLRR